MRIFSQLLGLALLLAATAFAQQGTADLVSEHGLHRAVFRVPQGAIRVNFPDDAAAGDTLSGTVYPNPSGKDDKERERNGAELSGYVIEMADQKTRAAQERFQLRLPERVVAGFTTLVLRDRRNRVVAQTRLPVDPRRQPPASPEWILPTAGQASALVSAWGPADRNSTVTLNRAAATVIAQSPRKLVFQVPSEESGRSKLEIRSGGQTATGVFYILGIRLSAPQTDLIRGQSTVLTVRVSGLDDLKEPADLMLTNLTPAVVAMSGGSLQAIVIEPSMVLPDGSYLLTRSLTSLQAGGFNISGVVTRAPSANMPFDRMAGRAMDNWSRATGILMSPEARSMISSEVTAARQQLDNFLRAQLAFRADAGSIIDSMLREYCFELRDRKLRARLGRVMPPRLLVNAFVPQGAPAPPAPPGFAPAPMAIDAADVKSHSLLQYLGQLLARLTPSRPVGDLLVISQPDRQMITIDQTTGINYYTTRTFVVSVGSHTVSVGPCKEVVNVGAYQKVTMNCPRV